MIDYVQELLLNATQNVAWQYFQIPVADGKPTFRERAYAYELYHQLRCFASEDRAMKDLLLCGELDKSGHRVIQERKTPDFVLHIPGEMTRNLAVVEIKSIRGSAKGIKKDLDTLALTCPIYR